VASVRDKRKNDPQISDFLASSLNVNVPVNVSEFRSNLTKEPQRTPRSERGRWRREKRGLIPPRDQRSFLNSSGLKPASRAMAPRV
jgi:hypothetical protein